MAIYRTHYVGSECVLTQRHQGRSAPKAVARAVERDSGGTRVVNQRPVPCQSPAAGGVCLCSWGRAPPGIGRNLRGSANEPAIYRDFLIAASSRGEYLRFQPAAGRLNVAAVAIRNDREGRECLQRCKTQCLADCTLNQAQ